MQLIEPVFIIGGGPSAASLELDTLRGAGTVIVINDGFKRLEWADICFTADGGWFHARRADLRDFKGHVVAALWPHYDKPGLRHYTRVRLVEGHRVSRDPRKAFFADNSGFAALNWAVACGARQIALIGYDLGPSGGHWHGGYEWASRIGPDHYPDWIRDFERVAPGYAALGADIVNVNRNSHLRCFRFEDFGAVRSGAAWRQSR